MNQKISKLFLLFVILFSLQKVIAQERLSDCFKNNTATTIRCRKKCRKKCKQRRTRPGVCCCHNLNVQANMDVHGRGRIRHLQVGDLAVKNQLTVQGVDSTVVIDLMNLIHNLSPEELRNVATVLGIIGAAGPQGAQGIAGVLGAIGAAGPVGAQGIAGALGAIGAAGSDGPAGPAGVAGAIGAIGAAGARGAIGATGATGIPGIGGILGYAYVYNTSPQVIALEADIAFDFNGLITSEITHSPGTSQIQTVSAGIYLFHFSVSGTEPSQFALFQNGNLVAGSIYGSGAGTQQNNGQVIVAAAAGDVFTIRNHTSAAAVTLAAAPPIGGTASAVNASVLIERIA